MGASASREKFRESVASLVEVDVSPDDADFWDELWKIPSSAEEVFELISPTAARTLRDQRFDNLATLFTQATAQLCQIVETPYNIYFDQALNCVRVLTRVLPFLLEKGDLGTCDPNIEVLCWGTGTSSNNDPIVGRVVGGGDQDPSASSTGNVIHTSASQDDESRSPDDETQEPLALLVVHAAFHMLFLPQFTCDFHEEEKSGGNVPATPAVTKNSRRVEGIDSHSSDNESVIPTKLTPEQVMDKKKEEEKQLKKDRAMKVEAGLGEIKYVDNGISMVPKPANIIWAQGCGFAPSKTSYEGGARRFDKNRVEVLRLVLAACCDPLFSQPTKYNPLASRWLAVAAAADAPNAICLFYSLFNTILSYDPRGGVAYTSAFASDTHVKLVELSAQVLCVLLDYGIPGCHVPVKNNYEEPSIEYEETHRVGFNIFRTLLARIDSGRELSFIYNGFCRLLRSVHESKSSLLPANSSKRLQCFQELLILLWKCIEENPLFLKHVVQQCDVTSLLVPICFLMYQSRKDPSQVGLVQICTFVLLKLSGERSFGVNLSKPFKLNLPWDLSLFTGGHTDLLCITIHKLIVNGTFKLVPLYSCFLTIMCNISPYWRSMSLVAAVKLVNLFELLSSPKFLYSGEKAYRHLVLLLEVFNNVLQYQFNGNEHLVYSIIRRKDSFGKLASLTLEKATEQYNKLYGEKKAPRLKTEDNVDDRQDHIISFMEVSSQSASGETGHILDSHGTQANPSLDNFFPTKEWVDEVKRSLPLETITRLLAHLVPVVDEIIDTNQGAVDESDLLQVLAEITMVGLLPVPHPIIVRKYQPNQYTALWFTAFLWGVVFLRNQSPPVFDGEAVALFHVDSERNKNIR